MENIISDITNNRIFTLKTNDIKNEKINNYLYKCMQIIDKHITINNKILRKYRWTITRIKIFKITFDLYHFYPYDNVAAGFLAKSDSKIIIYSFSKNYNVKTNITEYEKYINKFVKWYNTKKRYYN